jgi:hypothetical protein
MAAPSGSPPSLGALTLLSGPDLGGGYLHQLSVSPEGDPRRYTYHAQDGGADAGGPPIGSLAVLGFSHPVRACQFGGPRCWHRDFSLPFDRAASVRAAYNRFRFTLEATLRQAYASAPVALAAALREITARLAVPLRDEGIEWYLGGSVAGWLQGGDFAPREIDLGIPRSGVERVAGLLAPYLIEPAGPTDWPGVGTVRGARAFVGTLQEGARVGWSVPDPDRPPLPLEEFSGVAGVARIGRVEHEGTAFGVSRPEYGLVRAAVGGRGDAERRWLALVRRLGPDRELLGVLLARSPLDASRREALRLSALGP